jgi:uncharacterized protein (DUF983 family)
MEMCYYVGLRMAQRKRDLPAPPRRTFLLALTYLYRAMLLRCPLCGQYPLFTSLRRTYSIYDWLTPLDGCPRCGYAYDREDGYWLVPVWIINFGFSGALGLIAAYVARPWLSLGILQLAFFGAAITALATFLLARHAKALFIAIDRYFDPE